MRLRSNDWLLDRAPWLPGRRAGAAHLNLRGGVILFPILAAAHAEAGDFKEAVRVGECGAAAQAERELREEAEHQLSYDRAGEPYREEAIIFWKA